MALKYNIKPDNNGMQITRPLKLKIIRRRSDLADGYNSGFIICFPLLGRPQQRSSRGFMERIETILIKLKIETQYETMLCTIFVI